MTTMPSKTHDVFLSHASADKEAVEVMARKLLEAGIKPWFDKWDLVPGTLWQPALAAGLAASKSIAVFVGPSGVGPWEDAETMVALDRAFRDRTHRVIPALLSEAPSTSQLKLPAFLELFTWVDFRNGNDDPEALRRLIAGIRGEAPGSGEQLEVAIPGKQRTPAFRLPKLPKRNFDSYGEAIDLIAHVASVLDSRSEALREQGISVRKIADTPTEKSYRFLTPGNQQYHFTMALGQVFGPDTIGFRAGSGKEITTSGWHGFASVEWDRDSQMPVIKLTNFSLLLHGASSNLSKEAFADAVWDSICSAIERLV